jgi:hypothetical protein
MYEFIQSFIQVGLICTLLLVVAVVISYWDNAFKKEFTA